MRTDQGPTRTEPSYVGTSSWKYPGWCGTIYDEQRYQYRGKFTEKRFNDACLSEYAETYSTVCVDTGYYKFPTVDCLAGLCDQVPEGFKFAFKVTDDITIKRFPQVPHRGVKGGLIYPDFLNAEMFTRLFLEPCSGFRSTIGPLIFEVSTLHKKDIEHGRAFVQARDTFLDALPRGWQYGVETNGELARSHLAFGNSLVHVPSCDAFPFAPALN